MSEQDVIVIGASTVIVVLIVAHYGRAGLNGIFYRKMRYRGLVSWQFHKFYELQGDAALVGGIFFVAMYFVCVVSWLASMFNLLLK